MWINKNSALYEGDCQPGDREATAGEIAVWKTPSEADYKAAMQAHLDAKAREYGYDSILSACTYADDATVPLFQHQGVAFRVWRSQVWAFGYALMADVIAERVAQPTVAALVAQLPTITVPTT